jgi:nitrate/nitrite transporter NarK
MSVLKAHYFLWFGSLSGIMPFVPIFARQHAVADAKSVGILYCILPFVVSFMKPLFCSIADRNNAHKSVLIISIALTILGYGLLLTTVFINFGSFSWYWFCILVLIANSGQGVVISLNDYLVMKECTETNKSFGSYRVYGTIGWGGFGMYFNVFFRNNFVIKLKLFLKMFQDF